MSTCSQSELDLRGQVDYEATIFRARESAMPTKDPNRQKKAQFVPKDGVAIIVTQAFCSEGHSLMGISDVKFDGYPAVSVRVVTDTQDGLVHLSPLYGDARKACDLSIARGERCKIFCPVGDHPLDCVGHDEQSGVGYYAIYLTSRLGEGELVAVSDLWDDFDSRLLDNVDMFLRDEGEPDE